MFYEKGKNFWRSISLTLILCLVMTSMPAMAFAAEENESAAASETAQVSAKDLSEVTMEDVIEEESSEYVTVFNLGGNQKAKVFTAYPVRFEDEKGEMAEVEPELVTVDESETTEQGVSLSGYAYENKAGAIYSEVSFREYACAYGKWRIRDFYDAHRLAERYASQESKA